MSTPRREQVPLWAYRAGLLAALGFVAYFLQGMHTQQQADHDLLIELRTEMRTRIGVLEGEQTYIRERLRAVEDSARRRDR